MERRECYQGTRNYGCRIRRYLYEGVEMISLENQLLKAVFAIGKGADLVELVYKPMDVDYLWHSFNTLKTVGYLPTVASAGGSFLDTYVGGWQDLFPTYGSPAQYHGGQIGIHGEACIYPWNCAVIHDEPERISVCMTLNLIRSPFRLEKTVTLEQHSSSLELREKVTNLGTVDQDFMWGQHPAFGFPFLEQGVELQIGGQPTVTVPASTIAHHCPFDRETTGLWPMLPDKNGKMMDMSRACAPEDQVYTEYYLSNLPTGEYHMVNHRLGLGLRLRWDKKIFPYLWVWGLYRGIDEYPWYGRAYVMAAEPWSTMPSDYNQAKQKGGLLHLPAQESLETVFVAEATRIE